MDQDRKRVLGIDPSLTATGISDGQAAWTLKPPKGVIGLERQRWIGHQLLRAITAAGKPAMVVIEGPSYGSTKAASSAHERAGLWWRLVDLVEDCGVPYAVAPPSTVKKYATGKGNADKDAVMLATARRFDWFAGDNNAADALWLAALGAELVGEPLLEMPALNRTAVDGVELR